MDRIVPTIRRHDRPRVCAHVGAIALAVAVLGCLPAGVAGQTVLVRVLDAADSAPTTGALAYLLDGAGETVRNALTDERGRVLFVGIPAGSYSVRVEMIGMATTRTDAFDIAAGTTVSRDVRMESSAIMLEGLDVELEAGRCEVRPGGEGLLVSEVWDEARKALSAASFTDQQETYRYETERYDRTLDRESGALLAEDRSRRTGYMLTPFESRPAEDLVENGFVQRAGGEYLYFAPDATVLLSDDFLDTHCFRLAEADESMGDLIGLAFEPTGDDRSEPDIAGTMWLDAGTAELQWLEYRYQYLDPDMTTNLVGGRVDFQRMPNGAWIVPEWWIRMPVMSVQTDFQGRQRAYIYQYHQTGGRVLEAREAGGRSLGQRTETGGIEGVVTDSVGLPLPGVRVGVVGASQEVFSNAQGEFSITGLTDGLYRVRFVEPGLEFLGYVPEPVTQDVIRGELSYLEYRVPSMGDIFFDACEGVARPEGSVVLAGSVVDLRGRPIPEATVHLTWLGYENRDPAVRGTDPDWMRETTDGFETTSSGTGFYLFCGVPASTPMSLIAYAGEDQTAEYEVRIPDWETGVVRVLQFEMR